MTCVVVEVCDFMLRHDFINLMNFTIYNETVFKI